MSVTRIRCSLKDFPRLVRKLGGVLEQAVVRGLQDGGDRLIKRIHEQVALTEPNPPIDTRQYDSAWKNVRDPRGSTVRNDTPQALWIEVGRRPGPVSQEGFEALVRWVIRHGLEQEELSAELEKARRAREPAQRGAITRLRRGGASKAEIAGARARHRAAIVEDASQAAAEHVAWAIRQALREKGYAPRHVLARALVAAKPDFLAAMEASLEKVRVAA